MMAGSVGRLSLVRPQFTGPPAASRRARIRGRLTVALKLIKRFVDVLVSSQHRIFQRDVCSPKAIIRR